MKTKNMINLFFLLVALTLSCKKNDSHIPSDGDKDITNNIDSTCKYGGIILDTANVKQEDQILLGRWQLISYVDIDKCTFKNEPNNLSKSIIIEFVTLDSIQGNTVLNSFNGNYNVNNQKIKFTNFVITEMCCEPEWTKDFSIGIYNTDYVRTQNDTLVIYYEQSKKAMIYLKLNN
jgi:heat shock protein HslJ